LIAPQSCLLNCETRCCDCFHASVSPQRSSASAAYSSPECGRADELDLFLRGELDALAVCIHQFLHCLDGVLQPLGLLQQQPVLPSQVPEDIGARVIEQGSDVVERHPDGPVHQHQVQSLDVGVGVFAVARRGADARTTRPMWS
jgi:hypothetical protein